METNSLYQMYFNCELNTKEEVHSFIAEIAGRDNSLSTEEVIQQLEDREKIGSTMIAEHVLLPHIESDQLERSQILFIRLAKPIENWDFQTKNICLVIVILLKKNESVNMKKRIALFTRSLADEEYLDRLINSQDKEAFINEMIKY
ncbi:PTS sugar transporter subunit IIA (plasmid) [Niallia taxi]|uniref:PTS sugar transporter subunit IIA n=1 Tax=Niallia taxi TaxID=2499688 RepID=A0A3S2TT92_9BACI|nr:PTS sugar transporter subunit IIA [Niallia taxi]MCM3213093.1 PTS sugar transporter subunit IIA [Niallia taxi]MED4036433.1 PTS sugar transporter subunit IIA [Niallia taxi]RVT60810.1 PTS sugar transporter subunit IIA [Niallia taxi]